MISTYWRLMGFAKPIEKYAVPYFFYTLFYALFNTFNFVMIIPIIQTILEPGSTIEHVTSLPPFALNTDYLKAAVNFILYRIYGPSYNVMSVLILLAAVVTLSSFLSNLFRYLGQRTIKNMEINTLRRLRNDVFDNVMTLSAGYFSNERKGDIISKITSDIQVVQFCISNTLQVLFREPFLIFGYMFALIKISWELTIFSALFLPLTAFLIGTIVKRLRRPAREVQENFGNMVSVLDESLSGIKVVKAYNATGYFERKFHEINEVYSRIARSMAKRQQLASPMSEFLGITAAAVLLIFGGMLVMRGSMGLPGFLTYLAIFTQITRPVRSFTDAFANINQGIAAGDRVLALLDTKTTIHDAPDAVPLTEFRESIEFRDVRFSYENREVICGVSFTVKKGETVALVGPSGGGKSTIADLIPRFYDVCGGEILIDGHDIRRYGLNSMRAKMGIVAQDTVLFNDTIENNIRLGNSAASFEEVENAARVANAHRFIMETDFGYQTNIGDRGAKLSGGQRQRLSIARAVLKNPEILILDEATSALDTEGEKLVQEALNKLLKGRTSVVVAHRLSTIQHADRILVIERGRIAEEGTHAELTAKKGIYYRLTEMQQLD